jgi:hypothetical protein
MLFCRSGAKVNTLDKVDETLVEGSLENAPP